jgi:hypothetical protein
MISFLTVGFHSMCLNLFSFECHRFTGFSRYGLFFCLSSFLSLCFFVCPNILLFIFILLQPKHVNYWVDVGYVSACISISACLVHEVFADFLLPIDMPCLHSIIVLAVLLVLMVIVTNIYFSLNMDAPYISHFFYRMKLQHIIYGFLLYF